MASRHVEKLAYRLPEAASALGVSRSSVYRLIASGELRAAKVGGSTVIPKYELEALLAPARAA